MRNERNKNRLKSFCRYCKKVHRGKGGEKMERADGRSSAAGSENGHELDSYQTDGWTSTIAGRKEGM